MSSASPTGSVRVTVTRSTPVTWAGHNVGGVVAIYDHMVDDEWIRDHHGGGVFTVAVKTQRQNGTGWTYAGSRSVTIGGDPRIGLPVPRMTAVIVQGAVTNRVEIIGSNGGARRLQPSRQPKERRACHCSVCGKPGHSRRSKQCRLAPET